jgi:hypothetical protein
MKFIEVLIIIAIAGACIDLATAVYQTLQYTGAAV